MKDMLKHLFKNQAEFQKIMKNTPVRNDSHLQKMINITILSIISEAIECLNETPWKDSRYVEGGWHTNQKLNLDKLHIEIADLWCFVINLSLYASLDAEKLFETLNNKNKLNKERYYPKK